MSNKLKCGILWLFGLTGVVLTLYGMLTNPAAIPDEPISPILKYSLPILFINVSLAFMILPFLAMKGIVTLDYYQANKYDRAKNNVIMPSLCAPGIIIVFIAAVKLHAFSPPGVALAGTFLMGFWLYNLVTVLKHRRGKETHKEASVRR